MKARKILAMVAALALTAALAIGGTLAYLTSQDTVQNTFTVGKVSINLDEAKVKADGTYATDENNRTEEGNKDYKLMPGRTYIKDPTVTVLDKSEPSYVRMIVKVTVGDQFDTQFPNGMKLEDIVGGQSSDWTLADKGRSGNVFTYEYRHNGVVSGLNGDNKLPPLFTSLTVPGTLSNDQLNALDNLDITITAQAIQADGFVDTKDGDQVIVTAEQNAWNAFGA